MVIKQSIRVRGLLLENIKALSMVFSVSDPYHFDADPDPDPRIRFWDDGSGSGSGSGSGNSNFFLKKSLILFNIRE